MLPFVEFSAIPNEEKPMKNEELAIVAPAAMPVVQSQSPDVAVMLKAIVDRGIKAEDVGALEKIVGLYERMEDKNAERQYAAALGALQSECQNVVATKDVDGKFRYAPFLDIWNAVRPAVERNRFTLQWSQRHLGDKIEVTLTLQHIAGHKRDFGYGMRLGTNAPGSPQGSQAPVLDSITESRAKRRLLMDALNIVVDAVTPAEDIGDGSLATQDDCDNLFKRLVVLVPEDDKRRDSERRLLALAGVTAWNQITKAVIPVLQRIMSDKERAAARKGAA
jgi:hypothetical protein